jgi:hypothetical protein
MPDISTAKGGIEETITRRRIVSAEKASPPPDFWEYLGKLKPEDWVSPTGGPSHSVYVYRDVPLPTLPLGKCTTSVFSEVNCAWNDPEEMEMAFLAKFGGGSYRLILKRGPERICVGHMQIPGPYKNLTARVPESVPAANPAYGTNPPNGYDPTADIARTAINTMANQDRTVMDIATGAIAKAAAVIKDFTPNPPPPAPAPADDLTRALQSAMIARLTADPLETFVRLNQIVRETSPATNGGVAGSVTDKLIGAAVDRLLNPPAPAASGPAGDIGSELVRILPSVAGYITQGMAEYARIMEAQQNIIALQKQPGYQVPPPRPQPQVLPPPAPAQMNGSTDAMQFIESKIIEILREPQSAEWAAEEALSFLDRMDPNIVRQLTSQGEQGLMSLFQSRETLKPALQNLPRLQEFIRSFLRFAGENAKPEVKPN